MESDAGAVACTCIPGYIEGNEECELCGAGSVAVSPSSTVCQVCVGGTYSDALPSSECTACPLHATTLAVGSTSQAACVCGVNTDGVSPVNENGSKSTQNCTQNRCCQ